MVELTAAIAGPFSTRVLADLGADVLTLEPRGPEGYVELAELADRIGAFLPNLDSTDDPLFVAGARHQAGRGKRSIVLGKLSESPEIQEALREAHVFVQNFAPGVAAARGFGFEDILEHNPHITYVSLSGFGQSGPYESVPAFAPTTEAEAGFDWLARYPDGRRGDDVLGLGDYASGLEAIVAMLASLLTYGGDELAHHIDISQAEATIRLCPESIAMGRHAQRDLYPDAGVYKSLGSDEWVAICPTDSESAMRLRTLVGEPTPGETLNERIAAWTSVRDKKETAAELQSNGIAAAPVLYVNEVFAEPFLNRTGLFTDLEDNPVTGITRYEGLPIRFDGWSPSYIPGPHIGETHPKWMQLQVQTPAGNSNANQSEEGTT